MRKYTSAEECTEKTEYDGPPFWFYGESIQTCVFNNTAITDTSFAEGGLPRLVY